MNVFAGAIWAGLLFAAADGAGVDLGGKPVSEWVKQLRSENRGLQLRAAQALSGAPAGAVPGIVPEVLPLLKSERENDRFVAAQVLGEYGPAARAAVPELVPLLQGTQFERNRAAAAKALGLILKDAQPGQEVERVAVALAAKFNDDYDRYSDVRREAVRAIGMIGPAARGVIPKLTRGLTDYKIHSDEHRLVRQQAAWTCGRMGPLAAMHMDRLISMLHAEGIRIPEIAEAMGLIGPVHENVVPNLLDAYESSGPYEDSSPDLKLAILGALERFGPKAAAATPMIAAYLKGDRARRSRVALRTAMMRTLAAIGPAAGSAAPEIEGQIRAAGAAPADAAGRALLEEATRAYKAVTGRDYAGATGAPGGAQP